VETEKDEKKHFALNSSVSKPGKYFGSIASRSINNDSSDRVSEDASGPNPNPNNSALTMNGSTLDVEKVDTSLKQSHVSNTSSSKKKKSLLWRGSSPNSSLTASQHKKHLRGSHLSDDKSLKSNKRSPSLQ